MAKPEYLSFNPNKLKRHLIQSGILFLVVWLSFSYASGVFSHFSALPKGIHQSAQCDRASLAQNYYYNGFNFIYPEVNETRCIDGVVSCEMPVISYLAALSFKIFSYDEFYFRLISYCFFSGGMMALYFLFLTRMGHLLSLLFVLFVQSSPIILFYCNNFLPDISSLGLALMAWYLFFRRYISHEFLPAFKSKFSDLLFILCLGLSVAVKTTSLLQWLSMSGLLLLSFIPVSGIQILNRKSLILSLSISLAIPLGWYMWSRHLAATHNSQYFMMGLPQFVNAAQYKIAWQVYLANWPTQALSYPLIYIASGLMILTVFLRRFIKRELWTLSLLNTLGSAAFLGLMIEQFKYHDYYIICLFPSFALNWMALADAASKIKVKFWWVRFGIFILLCTALNYQFNQGRKNLEERYTEGNYWEQSHHRSEELDSFRTILSANGVDRNSCVIAGYDPAPNNMLYLLHLRGHRLSKEHDDERLKYILSGAHPRYLISNDTALSRKVIKMTKSGKVLGSKGKLQLIELLY